MVFLNIYLLGGLALLGVPVVLHFWMRQKPRRLPFPAFRFLRQRSVVNRRRMRLQHLLLLALRMLVLAALCFAIAQPKLFLPRAMANWFGLSSPRPAAAVFVFDVSYRMEYRVGGVSRPTTCPPNANWISTVPESGWPPESSGMDADRLGRRDIARHGRTR